MITGTASQSQKYSAVRRLVVAAVAAGTLSYQNGTLNAGVIGSNNGGREQVERWKADVAESDWQYVVLHHSATDTGSVESIHAEHSRRKDSFGNPWLGIGYHFVIGNGNGMSDGEVVATFRWKEQLHGAHSGQEQFNARGIGVCLIGNFELAAPTAKQTQSLRRLLIELCRRHEIEMNRVIGHSSVRATACPGKLFPLQQLRKSVQDSLQG